MTKLKYILKNVRFALFLCVALIINAVTESIVFHNDGDATVLQWISVSMQFLLAGSILYMGYAMSTFSLKHQMKMLYKEASDDMLECFNKALIEELDFVPEDRRNNIIIRIYEKMVKYAEEVTEEVKEETTTS